MALKKSLKKAKPKKRSGIEEDNLGQDNNNRVGYLNILKKFTSKKTYFLILLISGFVILTIIASRFLVVAWVDKQPISRIEYLKVLDQKYGKALIDQMVVEKLLDNEAKKKAITVSAQEITQETKKIEESQGGAEQLNQILQLQRISKDEFKKIVRLQILQQKVFGSDVKITDEEVAKYIESNKEQFKDVDDKTKEEVKEQLRQQKASTNFKNFMKSALEGPRVVRVQ